jgi:Na+/melibiose symporter-like transporter
MQGSSDVLIEQRLAYCLENSGEDVQFETIYDHLLHYYTKVMGMSLDDAIDVIFNA